LRKRIGEYHVNCYVTNAVLSTMYGK